MRSVYYIENKEVSFENISKESHNYLSNMLFCMTWLYPTWLDNYDKYLEKDFVLD
jgi:hypothetical protein